MLFLKKPSLLFFLFISLSSKIIIAQTSPTLDFVYNSNSAILTLPASHYDSWINDDLFSDNGDSLKNLTKILYNKLNDDFDFIILLTNEIEQSPKLDYVGKFINVSNNIKGIGLQNFDYSGDYGSAGKLKGVIHLPANNYITYGPSLHEVIHNVANSMIVTSEPSHWGFTGSNLKGQLGGFQQNTLIENVNGEQNAYSAIDFGSYVNGGNSVKYSYLELYALGLIPIDSIKEFSVFKDVTPYSNKDGRLFFRANVHEKYDGNKIVTKNGPRIPSYTTSQKSFKILFVLVTDNSITEIEKVTFMNQVTDFTKHSDLDGYLNNFYEATYGLATLDTNSLNSSLKTPLKYSVVFPNEFIVLDNNSETTIKWNYSAQDKMNIDLYQNGIFHSNLGSNISMTGELKWNIPDSVFGDNFRIKISSSNPLIKDHDFSNSYFNIRKRTIKVGGVVLDEKGNPKIGVKVLFNDKLIIDQAQTKYSRFSSVNSSVIQTFTPGSSNLSKIDLLMYTTTGAYLTALVEILDDNNDIIGVSKISTSATDKTWEKVIFNPSLILTPNQKYKIKLSSDFSPDGYLFWGSESNTDYVLGEAEGLPNTDYCFKTYSGNGLELITDAKGEFQAQVLFNSNNKIFLDSTNAISSYPEPVFLTNVKSEKFVTLKVINPSEISGYVYDSNYKKVTGAELSLGTNFYLDQSQTGSNSFIGLSTKGFLQSFIPKQNYITRIDCNLKKLSDLSSGGVWINLYNEFNESIASSYISSNSVSLVSDSVSVYFNNKIKVIPNKLYYIGFSASNPLEYSIYGSNSNNYKDGSADFSTSFDFYFKTYYGDKIIQHTDENGFYKIYLDPNWSGVLSASFPGMFFEDRSVFNVIGSKTNFNFLDGKPNGLNQEVFESSLFYPNPVQNELHFNSKSYFTIIDLQGVILLEGIEDKINVDHLSKGVYIINLDGITSKFIKE